MTCIVLIILYGKNKKSLFVHEEDCASFALKCHMIPEVLNVIIPQLNETYLGKGEV